MLAHHRSPFRRLFWHFTPQAKRLRRAHLHPERISDRRPDFIPNEDITVGNIEDFVRAGRCRRRPFEGTREQSGIDRFENERRTPGIRKRQSSLLAESGEYAYRGYDVQIAADRLAHHQLWP